MNDDDDTYPVEMGRILVDAILLGRIDMTVGDQLFSTYFEKNKCPFHNMGDSLVRMCVNY